jgi:hypothetical protein
MRPPAVGASLILVAAVAARSGLELMMMAEVDQRVDPGIDEQDHVAAAPAVAAGRPAEGNVFFAAEGHGAIAAFACRDLNLCRVEKHEEPAEK